MANLNAAVRQVLRARREIGRPDAGTFDRYRPAYETLLGATERLAGEAAFDELKQWMIETTRARSRLPTPEEVRRQALAICEARGVDVPQGSPLSE